MFGTDPILNSRWDYELASLERQQDWTQGLTDRCLGTLIRQECTLNILVRWGHQFWPANRGGHDCVVYSNTTVSRAIGWAVHLPMCSSKVPWLGGLKAVCSNNGLWISFSDWEANGRSSPKATNSALCGLDSRQSIPISLPGTWPLVLLWGQSALPICLLVLEFLDHTSSLCSCQPFLSDGDGDHGL